MKRAMPPAAFLLPVVVFVAAFAVLPAGILFAQSVSEAGGGGGIVTVLSNPVNLRSIDNSLFQGGISAVLAVGIGYPAGVFVGRYAWRGRSLVRSLLLLPFLLPSLVVVLGVLDLFGPSGLLSSRIPAFGFFGGGVPAIVAANLVFNVPIVVLLTATGAETGSVALEETVATLGGSPFRAYRDVWGSATWVGATAGGLLTFLFSALSFAPPLVFCSAANHCFTVEAQIWALDTQLLDPASAGVLALGMVLLFLLPTAAYLFFVSRLRPAPGEGRFRPRRVPWRTPFGIAIAVETATVLGAIAVFLGAVLYRTLLPYGGGGVGSSWSRLFSAPTTSRLGISATGALGNTLFFAVLAAVTALLLGILAGYAVALRPRHAVPLGLLLFVPLLISPIVLAFSLASFWRPLLGGESSVWALVVVSQATLALPFALQSLEVPLLGLSPEGRDSVRTLGATSWGAFLDADLPRVRDGLTTAGLFAFALGLGEFSATYFLVTPQYTTLSVALYHLTFVRMFPVADAASGLLLLLSLAVFLALVLGGRRVEL